MKLETSHNELQTLRAFTFKEMAFTLKEMAFALKEMGAALQSRRSKVPAHEQARGPAFELKRVQIRKGMHARHNNHYRSCH